MPSPDPAKRKADVDRDHELHPVVAPRGGATAVEPDHLAPEDAWAEVEQILDARTGGDRLPALARDLDDTGRTKLVARARDLLVFPGDVILDTFLASGSSFAFAISFAPYGTPPVNADKVKAYVRELRGTALADLSGNAFLELRKIMPGDLAAELPNAVRDLHQLFENADFVRWYLTTTPPRLAAHDLAQRGTKELAATLDAQALWGWLDHLRGAQGYYQLLEMHAATTDPAAKAQLAGLLGPLAGPDADAKFADFHTERKPALEAELKKPGSDATAAELVELFAQGAGTNAVSMKQIGAALRRARATPDDAVQVAAAQWAADPAERIRLVLDTPSVTAAHVLVAWQLLGFDEHLAVLKDDGVRRALRKLLGKGVRLRDLIDTHEVSASGLLADEGLRRWFADEARPIDLLWLAASGTPAECAKVCRVLRADGTGLSWVHDLVGQGASPQQLRVLANNCGDKAIATFLREHVIREWTRETVTHGEAEEAAVTDPASARTRLDEALAGTEAGDLLARVADLDDAARAAFARDSHQVARLLARIPSEDLLRACDLLGLSFGAVVAGIPQRNFHRGVVAYLRTRPVEEEHAVLASKELLRSAVDHVHPDPLMTLPSLDDPRRLAAAIALYPNLVERLLAGSEPSRALRLLAAEPVRSRAAPYLVNHPEVLDALPGYEHLTKKGQNAFDQLGGAVKQVPEHDGAATTMDEIAAGEYEDGDHRAAERGKAADHAAQQRDLASAVSVLVSGGAETHQALAIIHKFRREVPALVADPARWPVVDQIRSLVGLLPSIAFPDLGLATLVRSVNTRRWMFELGEAFLTLHAFMREPASRITVAIALHDDEPGSRRWLERLPQGAGLSDQEEEWLDSLQEVLADATALRALFKTRFGFPAPAQYDARMLHQLYGVLVRLPDGHLQQERIRQVASAEAGPQADGYWSPERKAIVIDDDLTPDTGTKTVPERASWMTAEQVRERYGFDESTLRVKVEAGLFLEQPFAEGTLYQLARVEEDRFTSTILHEVGHAVDEILGNKTSVIFDRAGWKQYGPDDFEPWAQRAGGWDKVAAGDRPKIKQAWVDALFTAQPVKSLVPEDHPVLSSRYQGVGVCDDARAGKTNNYQDRIQHGDHVFVMQPYYQCFYAIPERTSQVAPSDYAMYAPAEYFAECYVEYYRRVDGTADGQRAKGGSLPTWIKGWFDEHVDRVRFDPRRMKKGEATS